MKIDNTTSVVVSAAISVGYTLVGGMISVAYTDVFQLFFIGFGLVNPRLPSGHSLVDQEITSNSFNGSYLT